jgi:hypothetical protein
MGPAPGLLRRDWLAAAGSGMVASAAPALVGLGGLGGLGGCARRPSVDAGRWRGGWVGDAVAAGHAWRDRSAPAAPGGEAVARATSGAGQPVRRIDVLVVGAGIAGLAAARALRQAGIEDLRVLELHAQAGGNSRGHELAGQRCPMGAHYLPVPGPAARELLAWLHEIGLARHELGRTRWDERHLCHAPQERLWFEGAWHEGLLPPFAPASAGLQQAQRLSRLVEQASREVGFSMPSVRTRWSAAHDELDRVSFGRWLDGQRIDDPTLRWYLDYCCRDDYGAPAAQVSAWAGLH